MTGATALRAARRVALVLAVLLMPSPAQIVLIADPFEFNQVAIRLADLPLAALIALAIPEAFDRVTRRRLGLLATLGLALFALAVVSFALHPAPQGVQTLFRLAAAFAIVGALTGLTERRERRLFLVALGLTAATQALLAIAQVARGDLLVTYDHPPLQRIGPYIAAPGTMASPYVLAGLALVAAAALAAHGRVATRPAGWLGAIALAIVPVGLSFSRAAALGLALAAAALLPAALRHRRTAAVLAALLCGALIPALILADGWSPRATSSSVGTSASIRGTLISQAMPLIALDPLFGVGPGRTIDELRRLEQRSPGSIRSAEYLHPPHSLPVVIATEIGLPAGGLSIALLAALGWRAVRAGWSALMIFGALLPYVLLDNYLWTAGSGLTLLAIWAGLILRGPPAGPVPESSASRE